MCTNFVIFKAVWWSQYGVRFAGTGLAVRKNCAVVTLETMLGSKRYKRTRAGNIIIYSLLSASFCNSA